MTERQPIKCICTGIPSRGGDSPCARDATQEDFLCDHCRVMRCETVDSEEGAQRLMDTLYPPPF